MKQQVIVSVAEEKYSFFIELMKSMDFVSVDDDLSIPEEHKRLVIERKRTATAESMKNWDDIKDTFKVN